MRRQIQTVDVLHREEEMSVDIADIVNAADVGMGHLPRYAYLIVKLGEAMRIGRECRREKLQRDRMAEPQILALIDDTHAAASELPDNPIAARQRRAVGQCRVPEVRASTRETGEADRVAPNDSIEASLWPVSAGDRRVVSRSRRGRPQNGQKRLPSGVPELQAEQRTPAIIDGARRRD